MQAYTFSTTCPYENKSARKTKYYNSDAPENAVWTGTSFLPVPGIIQTRHTF
jgi:hypothetical protein